MHIPSSLPFPAFASKVNSSDYFFVCVLKDCIALGLSIAIEIMFEQREFYYAARFSKFKMSSDLYIIVLPFTDFSYRQLHQTIQTLSVKV